MLVASKKHLYPDQHLCILAFKPKHTPLPPGAFKPRLWPRVARGGDEPNSKLSFIPVLPKMVGYFRSKYLIVILLFILVYPKLVFKALKFRKKYH